MELTPAVRALRDQFGDPKPPSISRKITACVACRKQKIKCRMRDDKPPCTRCIKRGLPCTVNRSLQMLIESDATWKEVIDAKVARLEAALSQLAASTGHPELARIAPSSAPGVTVGHTPRAEEISQRQDDCGSTDSDLVIDLASGPGVIPGFHISPRSDDLNRHQDLVSKGIISLEKASSFFHTYKNRLDHFPYRILGEHHTITIEGTRASSALLTAAICAVGALHQASEHFNHCYKEFVNLVAGKQLVVGATIDDIKALCIGAFWFSEISTTLVAIAVRMAYQLQLHHSLNNAIAGDKQHYLQTRLYYLVYACDHHSSIVYGRPPLTRDCYAVRNVRRFVESEHATEDDARIVSQVLRWSICSTIFDAFGGDANRPLSEYEILQLRQYSSQLDAVRTEWAEKFATNNQIGNYPSKGVSLQYYFAKLYLFSHVFRGRHSRNVDGSAEFNEMALSAAFSALAILRTVVSDPEVSEFLNGLPAYFDTMIAFAAVFLFKISPTLPQAISSAELTQLMRDLVTTLAQVTASMHPRHVLVRITKGIAMLLHADGGDATPNLDSYQATAGHDQSESEEAANAVEETHNMSSNAQIDSDWLTDEHFSMQFAGQYDLLYNVDVNNWNII